jgi:hypothetical protein
VSYAPIESAYIKFWSLKELEAGVTNRIRPLTDNEKTVDGLKELLKHQLAREFAFDSQGRVLHQNDPAFVDWTQTIVEVGYPFPLLAGGLSLCDVPGVASVDAKAVQDIIVSYFKSEPPLGVVLVYENPTFSDAEMAALRVLEDLYEASAKENPLSLFLVNSHADGRILEESYKSVLPTDRDEMIKACKGLIKQRYEILRERRAMLGPFPLEDTAEKHGAFAIMSSLDYGMVLYKLRSSPGRALTGTEMATKYLYEEQCIGALLDWALQRQKLRYQAALHKMSSGACVFFGNLMSAHEDRYQQAVKDQEKARLTLSQLKTHLESAMVAAFSGSNISTRVKDFAGRKDVINNMIKQAEIMKLDAEFEGKKGDKEFVEKAGENFQSKFIPILREHIFEPVLRDVIAQLREEANESLKQVEESAKNENDLLANALQGYWLYDPSLATAIQAQAAKSKSKTSGGINVSFIQWEWKRGAGAGVKAIAHGFLSKFKEFIGVDSKVDGPWKSTQAKMFLANVHQIFEHETVSQRCHATINESINDIQGRIDICISQIRALQEREKMRPGEIAKLRISLAELLVLCRADRQYLLDTVPVEIDRSSPTLVEEHCTQYRTGNQLVKVFHETALISNPATRRIFLDEVHFNTAVGFGSTSLNAVAITCIEFNRTTGISSPTPAVLPPLQSAYGQASSMPNASREWHLVFPSCPSVLGQVLETEKPYMTDLNCAELSLALTNRVCALCDSGMASILNLSTVYAKVTKKIEGNTIVITDIDVFPSNVKSTSLSTSVSYLPSESHLQLDTTENNTKRAQQELMEPLERLLFELVPCQPFPITAKSEDISKNLHPTWQEILKTCKTLTPHNLLILFRKLVTLIKNPSTGSPTYIMHATKPRYDTPSQQGAAPPWNPRAQSEPMQNSPDPFTSNVRPRVIHASLPPAALTPAHPNAIPMVGAISPSPSASAPIGAYHGPASSPANYKGPVLVPSSLPPSALPTNPVGFPSYSSSSPSPFPGDSTPFRAVSSASPFSSSPLQHLPSYTPPPKSSSPDPFSNISPIRQHPTTPSAVLVATTSTGTQPGLARASSGSYISAGASGLPADLTSLSLMPPLHSTGSQSPPLSQLPPLAGSQAAPQLGPRRTLGPKQPLGQSRLTQLPADVGFSTVPLSMLPGLGQPLTALPPLPGQIPTQLPPLAHPGNHPLPQSPGLGQLPIRSSSGSLTSAPLHNNPSMPGLNDSGGVQSFVPLPAASRPTSQQLSPLTGFPHHVSPAPTTSALPATGSGFYQPTFAPASSPIPLTTQSEVSNGPLQAVQNVATTTAAPEARPANIPQTYRAAFLPNLKHRFASGYTLLHWEHAETDEEGGEYQYKLVTHDGKVHFVAITESLDSGTLLDLQPLRDLFLADNPGADTLLLVENVMDQDAVGALPTGVRILRYSL